VTVARVPEREETGFGKRDVSDVASACMIAGEEGLARALVADLISCPVAELDARATVIEVLA
jgi:hypothetical protein